MHKLCIAVTMRLVALVQSLHEAQYLAGLVVLQRVLLCTLLGYRMVPLDEVRPVEHAVTRACSVLLGLYTGRLDFLSYPK